MAMLRILQSADSCSAAVPRAEHKLCLVVSRAFTAKEGHETCSAKKDVRTL